MNRRSFLRVLAASAGAIATAGIPFVSLAANHAKIWALLQIRIQRAEEAMLENMRENLWGDQLVKPSIGWLGKLLSGGNNANS